MLQVLIAMLLTFVLLLGIGFILNMLIKTTWFPIYFCILFLIPLMMYYTWDKSLSFMDNLTGYTIVDALPAVSAIVGAYVSGWAIRALRRGGYKMF